QRVMRRGAESQEESSRKTRRPAGIGLRLALISEDGVEDMRAEAGLGAMAAGAILVAEEGMQPAIALTAVHKIVDQLDMTALLELRATDLLDIDRHRLAPRQPPKAMPRQLGAGRVVSDERDRQFLLGARHRRRQRQRPPASHRQDRRRQDIAFAEKIAEFRQLRIGLEIGT